MSVAAPFSSATTTPTPVLRPFVLTLSVYLLAWALVPALLVQSFPLDVVESLGWGREWQWGYYKHPPLAPAVLHLFYTAFGKFGPFILSQLCVLSTLWLVWLTGCRLMDRERALLGTVLTMGVAYYSWPTLEFNHNIAQMPVWAGLGYCYLAAWQDQRRWQWALLGLLAGLGLLTKYSVGILLLCLAAFTVLTPARALLRSIGPWLALLILLVCIAPHLYWLWQSDWLPFSYTSARATAKSDASRWRALLFLATQVVSHLPLLLIAGISLLRARRHSTPSAARTVRQMHTSAPIFLLVIALAPGLFLTVLGIVRSLHLHDMWGAAMWPFSGLLVATLFPQAWLAGLRPRILRGMTVWLVLVSLLAGWNLAFGAQWRKRPARVDWPTQPLAQEAQRSWSQWSHCPLDTVAGDSWLAGLIATANQSGPSVLIEGDPRFSPWATRERVQQHGALWVGSATYAASAAHIPPALQAAATHQGLQTHSGQWQMPWPHLRNGPPLTVYWQAFVPEHCVPREAAPH